MAQSKRSKPRDPNVTLFYQQGDVLLFQAAIPVNVKLAAHGILARGEATGHMHRLDEATDGLLYEATNGALYLRVGSAGATVKHEEHASITLPRGDYRVGRVQEYDHFAEEARQVRD